jgi:hypothetical protein
VAWVYTFYAGGGKEMDGHYGCLGVDRVYSANFTKTINGHIICYDSGQRPCPVSQGSRVGATAFPRDKRL